jgi:hypothetical protein
MIFAGGLFFLFRWMPRVKTLFFSYLAMIAANYVSIIFFMFGMNLIQNSLGDSFLPTRTQAIPVIFDTMIVLSLLGIYYFSRNRFKSISPIVVFGEIGLALFILNVLSMIISSY